MVGPERPSGTSMPRDADDTHPLSPYSVERSLILGLTLPVNANLDIPPSPPGSLHPSANQKFKQFLDLKSQGVHFNEKLASSTSLRNPSLLSKLMEHAGIERHAQFSTSLPTEIWDPSKLPSWAFKEDLMQSSQEIEKREDERRVKGQRDAIDFVSATASGNSSRGGTPGGSKGPRGSAAERVMAELSRESTNSPLGPEQGKRLSRFDIRDRRTSPRRR